MRHRLETGRGKSDLEAKEYLQIEGGLRTRTTPLEAALGRSSRAFSRSSKPHSIDLRRQMLFGCCISCLDQGKSGPRIRSCVDGTLFQIDSARTTRHENHYGNPAKTSDGLYHCTSSG